MKDLVIIGAGDFAREVVWTAERMNQCCQEWNILGFVDDDKAGQTVDGYPVLGEVEWLQKHSRNIYATCAIGTGSVRKRIWRKLSNLHDLRFATIVDPMATVGNGCIVGEGSIICAGTILTVAVKVGFNCILNLNCTVGHDAVIDECCTLQPGSNISGHVHIGAGTDIGTGTKIIPGIDIAEGTILGAGSVVVRNIQESGTYAGVPARRLGTNRKL